MGRVYEALRRAAERTDARDDNADHTSAADATHTHDGATTNGNGADAFDGAGSNGSVAVDDVLRNASRATSPLNVSAATPRPAAPNAGEILIDHVINTSTILNPSPVAAADILPHGSTVRHDSASNGHTEQAAGTALPGAHATGSRAAGATLDAVSSARARQFPTLEIISARVEPHLVSITEPRSPHAERYRSLRTRVLQAGDEQKVQTIVITSSGVMEGKTVTSLNLTWQLAQADGVSALLIDGDLRHPCAAEYLGIDAPTGLSEVLAGEATLEDSIVRLEPAGLHLLPGGTARDDVADLLSGPRFAALIAEARRMFDYIIIDAPPLGIFTDAAVLINRADAALFVIRAGRVRFAQIDRLLEGLPQERILGVVLNGADEQIDESDYYYYRRDERKGLLRGLLSRRGARSGYDAGEVA